MAHSKKRKLVGIGLIVVAVVMTYSGWRWAQSSSEVSTDNAYTRAEVTSLASKVAGYVTSVEVGDNQTVQAGDVLFRIDDRDYRARLAQAEANVDAAKARLANVETQVELQRALVRQAEAQRQSSNAELGLAVKDSDRLRELVQYGAVSRAAVDAGDAARSRTEAGVAAAAATIDAQRQRIAVLASEREAAAAAIAQAEALRDLALIDLENTVVRAPVNGVIGNRQVRVGRLVTAGGSQLDIVPVDDIWIVANFKETQLRNVRLGQRVDISIDGYPGKTFQGVVDSFAPGSGSAFSLLPSDNATGNFVRVVQRVPVKIRFVEKEAPDQVVPGLSARVEVRREVH